MKKKEREREKKMYFDKRSPLINYIVEATIVYSTAGSVDGRSWRERSNNNQQQSHF